MMVPTTVGEEITCASEVARQLREQVASVGVADTNTATDSSQFSAMAFTTETQAG